MNKYYSILVFLVATTVGTETALFFHARIGNTFKPLSSVGFQDRDVLALDEPRLPYPSPVTLKNGVATIGNGNDTKTFGVMRESIVFSKRVKSFKVELNSESKVLHLEPYMCRGKNWRDRGVMMTKNITSSEVICLQSDIYLLPVKSDKESDANQKWETSDE